MFTFETFIFELYREDIVAKMYFEEEDNRETVIERLVECALEVSIEIDEEVNEDEIRVYVIDYYDDIREMFA